MIAKCVECQGQKLVDREVRQSMEIAGRTYTGRVPATVCAKCGARYVEAVHALRFDLGVAGHLARHGPVNGETLAFMRDAMGLQGKVLARELGVSPEHLSRWENGKKPMDRNAWLVVSDLVLDLVEGKERRTTMRDRIAAIARPASSKPVRVEPAPEAPSLP